MSNATRGRLVVVLPMTPKAAERAATEFDAVIAERALSFDEVIASACAHRAEAIMASLGRVMGAAEFAQFPPTVKILALTSVGYDHVDVRAANARGIVVSNTPDVLTDATADATLLLMLGAARRAKENMAIMAEGWTRRNGFRDMLGTDLGGKTLGIVGMGRIGRAVAQRARGFGMNILYHNRRRLPPELEGAASYVADLDAMLPRCHVLSLNLPGGQGTIMTRERFGRLPPGALFVNSARGSLVDEDALIEALSSGRLMGAGLDVFRREPEFDPRLRALPNAFLLPHAGSATLETREAMAARALDNVAAVLAGDRAPDEVDAG